MPPATGGEECQSDRGGDLRYFYICALRADIRTATEFAATSDAKQKSTIGAALW